MVPLKGNKAAWQVLYQHAITSSSPAAGYYNHNYVCQLDGHQVVLRVPIPGCDEMDLRVIPEHETLSHLQASHFPVPHVLHVSASPRFQIHEYIHGSVVNEVYPRGKALPRHFIGDVIDLMKELFASSPAPLAQYLKDWPEDGDSRGFFLRILQKTQQVYRQYWDRYGVLYRWAGVPEKPFKFLEDIPARLHSRPHVLCHCDIHRKNCLLWKGRTWFLDWELALVGDPVYDIAVHIHKMGYLAHEKDQFFRQLRAALPEDTLHGLDEDLPHYFSLEQAKSIIVDTVRYHKQIHATGTSDSTRRELANKYADKLALASELWNTTPRTAEEVLAQMLRCPA